MTIRNLGVGENCYDECLQNGAHEINCFPCFPSNEKKILMKKRSTKCKERAGVTSLFRNMSFESLDSQQTNLAEEIIKLGSRNISSNIFTYQELSAVTKDFTTECLVGEGGFGKVYKGKLSNTNQVVAIKRLDRNGFQGNREFLMEILMLSLYHHPNIVSLIGYCAEKDQRILVYEYMPMGSLEDHLFDICNNNKPLDWKTRMRIAKGAAKGLEYLHNSARPSVIYRDFKPSNILLDEDFNPKLSDFGLAKLGPTGDKSHVSTRVMGTYGYCAPEYVLTSQLSIKSDVYSFGAVFLEIITGKRVIDSARPTSEQNLVSWVQPIFRDRSKFESIVDPLLEGKYPIKDLYQALAVADMCLQEVASTRPFISDVVSALEYLSEPEQGSKDAMNSGYCHEVSEAGVRSHGIEVL